MLEGSRLLGKKKIPIQHSDSGDIENGTKILHCPTSSGASEKASERVSRVSKRASG